MNLSRLLPAAAFAAALVAALASGCTSLSASTSATSTASGLAPHTHDEHFIVYCVNQKLEVGSRSVPDMIDARGVDVCPHPDRRKPYPKLSDAQEAARELGGVGMPCTCQRQR